MGKYKVTFHTKTNHILPHYVGEVIVFAENESTARIAAKKELTKNGEIFSDLSFSAIETDKVKKLKEI